MSTVHVQVCIWTSFLGICGARSGQLISVWFM